MRFFSADYTHVYICLHGHMHHSSLYLFFYQEIFCHGLPLPRKTVLACVIRKPKCLYMCTNMYVINVTHYIWVLDSIHLKQSVFSNSGIYEIFSIICKLLFKNQNTQVHRPQIHILFIFHNPFFDELHVLFLFDIKFIHLLAFNLYLCLHP